MNWQEQERTIDVKECLTTEKERHLEKTEWFWKRRVEKPDFNAEQQHRSKGMKIIEDLLLWMGADPDDPGLAETPRRVLDAWDEMLSGYLVEPAKLLSVQFDAQCDEMVTLANIPFYSTCEHHLLPFSGVATVSYLPACDGKVVGISKLARLVECFGRRLQLQERMTGQIADALMEHLQPLGVGVHIEATHLCMVCRGIRKPGTSMRTTALRGNYRDQTVRQEFLAGL